MQIRKLNSVAAIYTEFDNFILYNKSYENFFGKWQYTNRVFQFVASDCMEYVKRKQV